LTTDEDVEIANGCFLQGQRSSEAEYEKVVKQRDEAMRLLGWQVCEACGWHFKDIKPELCDSAEHIEYESLKKSM